MTNIKVSRLLINIEANHKLIQRDIKSGFNTENLQKNIET